MQCKFKTRIATRRNFSGQWLLGAESVHISTIHDHARADQHIYAMSLLKQEHARSSGSGYSSYSPIAKALSKLSDEEEEQLWHKFDIAYFVAQERLSFPKYPRLYELEAHHGVAIGSTYTNEIAGKNFTHYITESIRKQLFKRLAQAKFFSLLMDGSTDHANIDDEMFMAVWCDSNGTDEKIHTRTTYFYVGRPSTVDATGLFKSLKDALLQLGISEVDAKNCSNRVAHHKQ